MWLKTKWKFLLCSSILACVINFLPVAADEHGVNCDCYECLSENWSAEQQEYLSNLCSSNGLDLSVLKAVAWSESRLQPEVTHVNTNGTTDWGMFQINDVCLPFLKGEIGLDSMNELLDPYTNINAAVVLMRYHKDATGDDALALMRYQCGEGTFKKKLQQGIYTTQTQQRVLQVAKEVEEIDEELEAKKLEEELLLAEKQRQAEIAAAEKLRAEETAKIAYPIVWSTNEGLSEVENTNSPNVIIRKKVKSDDVDLSENSFGKISFNDGWNPNQNGAYVTVGYTGSNKE